MATFAERPIAVYRLHPLAYGISIFVALLLQISLPPHLPVARLIDFPLLLTIYFSLMRRNRIFGTFLGTGLGLAQDALSRGRIGMFGMTQAVVGYCAAVASVKFNLDHFAGRLTLTGFLVALHGLMLTGLDYILMDPAPPFLPLDLASAVLLNTALAVVIYQLLDRFRRPV